MVSFFATTNLFSTEIFFALYYINLIKFLAFFYEGQVRTRTGPGPDLLARVR